MRVESGACIILQVGRLVRGKLVFTGPDRSCPAGNIRSGLVPSFHETIPKPSPSSPATLPALDEAQAATLAKVARNLVQSPVALSLTDEDRDGIARAREDFKAGSTHSSCEARAMTAAYFAKLRGTSPSA